MTHTAGPWHVGIGNGEGSVFAGEGRMRLEEAGTTLYPICKVFDFDGERDANAALIVAAPDLLMELEECVALIGKARAGYRVTYDLWIERIRTASEVIYKAKGG